MYLIKPCISKHQELRSSPRKQPEATKHTHILLTPTHIHRCPSCVKTYFLQRCWTHSIARMKDSRKKQLHSHTLAHTHTHTNMHISAFIRHARDVRWWPGHHHFQVASYVMNLKRAYICTFALPLNVSLFILEEIMNTEWCSFKIWESIHIYGVYTSNSCIICHMEFTRKFKPVVVNWMCPNPIYFILFFFLLTNSSVLGFWNYKGKLHSLPL